MKKTMCVLMAFFSFNSFAVDRKIADKIDRIQAASQNNQFDYLSAGEKLDVNQSLDRVISVLRLDDRRPAPQPIPSPGPGTGPQRGNWRYQQSFERNQVAAFSDDGCKNQVTEFRNNDRCERLEGIFGNTRIWSVTINGQCIDVRDSNFRDACGGLVALAQAQKPRSQDLEVFSDDGCNKSVTTIDPGVDCAALGTVLNSSKVWSVRIDKQQCVDVQDETFSQNACLKYQEAIVSMYENDGNRRRGDIVQLFSDDGCKTPVTSIKRGDNCSALGGIFGNKKVWSVIFRGQCVDIQDTDFSSACQQYSN